MAGEHFGMQAINSDSRRPSSHPNGERKRGTDQPRIDNKFNLFTNGRLDNAFPASKQCETKGDRAQAHNLSKFQFRTRPGGQECRSDRPLAGPKD
jgi:hypothetical protein